MNARNRKRTAEEFERRLRDELGPDRYRILVTRLVGAVRALDTIAEIAPELLVSAPTDDVPHDVRMLLAAMLERFAIENLEPAVLRQLTLVKR